ncbi:hypothetical protein SAMN05216570_1390 [Dyella sp. OK004]|nr:hypothetical protein SAMN05216570_1390 [Dyella sp. OK004]
MTGEDMLNKVTHRPPAPEEALITPHGGVLKVRYLPTAETRALKQHSAC